MPRDAHMNPICTRVMHRFLGLCLLALTTAAWAQSGPQFPNRPVRIVPFGTGGGPIDTLARAYGEKLSQRWGQPIVVDAKPGASGIIAADFVAKSAPDGYTVMMTMPLTHVNNAILMKLPYDPVKDFAWVSTITTYPLAFTVAPQSPIRSFQDLMQRAKAEPGKWSYSSVGVGTAMHLAAEWLQAESGVQLNHIPFKGGTGPMTELLAGRVDVMVDTMTLTAALLKDQRVRALAVTSPKGGSPLQGVPAVADFYPGVVFESWLGIAAPAATPAAVVERLNKALREVVAQPDVRQRLLDFGGQPQASSGTEFRDRVQRDILNLRKVVSERKIEPE